MCWKLTLVKLCCLDYGFDCNFKVESDNESELVEEFGKHSTGEHGIEYSNEVLHKFVLRKLS